MVPGMGHCRGGDGPNTFDTIGTLEAWREKGDDAGRDHGLQPAKRTEPTVVRVSAVREIQRHREYEGRGELEVRRTVSGRQ